MKILATDLDRTLLPNGSWPADAQAITMFNELTASQDDLLVVYVTGRNLALSQQAIEEYGIRYPDVLIGDVGTSIRRYSDGAWEMDAGWAAQVHKTSPRWDAAAVRAAFTEMQGMREQEREHCSDFKQSYYVDHARSEQVLRSVEERVKGKFDEVIVYSYDSQSGDGLLDFLPQSATKQTALEFVASELGVPKADTVFCGDSGNDIFPLTAGFCGVLVRNADEQLVENVRSAMAADPQLRVYFANGGYRGLNGYYTGGVLEGAFHYGVLRE